MNTESTNIGGVLELHKPCLYCLIPILPAYFDSKHAENSLVASVIDEIQESKTDTKCNQHDQ